MSSSPPTALATTGTPQAIASSGTMPNGSYQGVQTTRSAERSSAGTSGAGHRADQPDPVGHPEALGQPGQPAASGSPASSSAAGPPAMTSSASGTPTSARITVSKPLRGTSRPTHSSRGRSPARGHRAVRA